MVVPLHHLLPWDGWNWSLVHDSRFDSQSTILLFWDRFAFVCDLRAPISATGLVIGFTGIGIDSLRIS